MFTGKVCHDMIQARMHDASSESRRHCISPMEGYLREAGPSGSYSVYCYKSLLYGMAVPHLAVSDGAMAECMAVRPLVLIK